MSSVLFRFPNAGAPTATLTFRGSDVWLTQPQYFVTERINFAISGKAWYARIGTASPKRHIVQFIELAEATAGGYSGYTALLTFITSTVEFGRRTFDLTDSDAVTLASVRIIQGAVELAEAVGKRKMKHWTGEFILHQE